jgi:hypothetical protein
LPSRNNSSWASCSARDTPVRSTEKKRETSDPRKEVAAQTKNIWGAVRYLKQIVASNAPHLPRNADTAKEKK